MPDLLQLPPDKRIYAVKGLTLVFVHKKILEIARNSEEMYNYDRIRLQLEYQNVVMHIWFYRKIFASHLRQSGIVSKIVDLLQGRVGKSIFIRHYLTLRFEYRDRVLRSLNRLKKEIGKIRTIDFSPDKSTAILKAQAYSQIGGMIFHMKNDIARLFMQQSS
jgi:hypothetical protein